MCRDELFLDTTLAESPFVFSEDVAAVFDNMIERSVPCYQDIIKLITILVSESVLNQKAAKVYDLGCSTGNLMLALFNLLRDQDVFIEGVDASEAMLKNAHKKLESITNNRFKLVQSNLNDPICLTLANAIVLNLTLQFLTVNKRNVLLQQCYEALSGGGVVIIVEKIYETDHIQQKKITSRYELYKQLNGYSAKEIEGKKKALLNVLNPLSMSENESMFKSAGFRYNQVFKWLNFVGWELRKS